MTYTATFDASHKIKAGGSHATNFERHIARDVDLAAGFDFPHPNPNVDRSRTTRLNVTRVNDGAGGFRPLESVDGRPPSAELGDYLDKRLRVVTRKLKSDAVVMRPLVLMLDPEWFAEHNPDWRENGLNDEAWEYVRTQLDWACWEFGQENIVGWSLHLDETSPGLQVLMTPVTPDCRLSQKSYFPGPGDLNRQHRDMRDWLNRSGYDVDYAVSSRSTDHRSSAEFAAMADRYRHGIEENERRATALLTREAELTTRETALAAREVSLAQGQAALRAEVAMLPRLRRKAVDDGRLEGHEEGLADAEAVIAARVEEQVQAQVAPALAAAHHARADAEQVKVFAESAKEAAITSAARFEARLAALQTLPKVMDAFLDKPLAGGKTLRPAFEKFQSAYQHAVQRRLETVERESETGMDADDYGADGLE